MIGSQSTAMLGVGKDVDKQKGRVSNGRVSYQRCYPIYKKLKCNPRIIRKIYLGYMVTIYNHCNVLNNLVQTHSLSSVNVKHLIMVLNGQ